MKKIFQTYNALHHIDAISRVEIEDYINLCEIKTLPSVIEKAFNQIKNLMTNDNKTLWQVKERINNQKTFIQFLKNNIRK